MVAQLAGLRPSARYARRWLIKRYNSGSARRVGCSEQRDHCGHDPVQSHPVRPAPAKLAFGDDAAHSMTSSARARIEGGIVRPSALAVLRLTTSSKVVGCWTGRPAGLAPLRIFPA